VFDQKVFVNLPVKDLKRSMDFYTALGNRFNRQFTDETAACMVVSDAIYVMLLTEAKFRMFIPGALGDPGEATSVGISLNAPSRADVDAIVGKAIEAGGTTFQEPKDYGFMYQHSFRDVDGHVWAHFFMDPSVVKPE
jgi:predicted lactoylglutathione lyase